MHVAPIALDRVVAKYRRDVHNLAAGAPVDALIALEGHLGQTLPTGLRVFLTKHNGAQLFRGSLRIRSTSEMSIASEHARRVVLFADGRGDEAWAWARDSEGRTVFGRWTGQTLVPYHTSFDGWLRASIQLLETRVNHPRDREALRLEADPDDLYQLIRTGTQALRDGRPEEAADFLQRATATAPWDVEAWQRLGDALSASDRAAARKAWLQAFRGARLPLPWPGASCLDPEVLRPLSLSFSDAEAWEQALRRLLSDQVVDAASEPEAVLVVAAATALSRSLLERGKREEARDVLADLLARCRTFTHVHTPWKALLQLVRLEIDLGNHDEAEALLRRIRAEGAETLQAHGSLLLGRIAVTRQEPWAEVILSEAKRGPLTPAQKVELNLLLLERTIQRTESAERASEHLTAAMEAAKNTGSRLLKSRIGLAEGDLRRLAGQEDAARTTYLRALDLLADQHDPELRYRLHARLGDLALGNQRIDNAIESYRLAAEGFAKNGYPVREGWALLRLARLVEGNQSILERAREQFSKADLAAGIAATDAIQGDPGKSLPWHLERSAAHARARHNAQRSRPPLTRPDADRPERRLGAHRLAIAACSEGVVEAIATEMEACRRAMSTGRARASDPPVLRYIAAVDLLGGHRSFRAAQVLLDQLLGQRVEGPAHRALQGAMCRSPNAALVDGLLATIENATGFPTKAVSAAAELLGLRRERAGLHALISLAEPGGNPAVRKAAVTALGRLGQTDAVSVLIGALEEPSLAEQAALSLLMLGDRRGVDFHGRALAEHRLDLSGHPGEIVGRYGGPSHLLLLKRSAEGDDEGALGALQGLGLLGDPRAIPTLLQGLSARSRRVAEVAAGALTILTGHEEDLSEPGFKHRWHAWWDKHHGQFSEGLRYREGVLFDAAFLIRRMDHPDAWTRRTAYDELVITTGTRLPFDADGPWRIQRSHLRTWRRWWGKKRDEQPSGRWYLNGQQIS